MMPPPPPPTFHAITLQRAKLSPRHFMTIFFQVSRTFVTPKGTVPQLRNFLYMHVGPKKAKNVILCTKINANLFFHLVHINMIIFTLNG